MTGSDKSPTTFRIDARTNPSDTTASTNQISGLIGGFPQSHPFFTNHLIRQLTDQHHNAMIHPFPSLIFPASPQIRGVNQIPTSSINRATSLAVPLMYGSSKTLLKSNMAYKNNLQDYSSSSSACYTPASILSQQQQLHQQRVTTGSPNYEETFTKPFPWIHYGNVDGRNMSTAWNKIVRRFNSNEPWLQSCYENCSKLTTLFPADNDSLTFTTTSAHKSDENTRDKTSFKSFSSRSPPLKKMKMSPLPKQNEELLSTNSTVVRTPENNLSNFTKDEKNQIYEMSSEDQTNKCPICGCLISPTNCQDHFKYEISMLFNEEISKNQDTEETSVKNIRSLESSSDTIKFSTPLCSSQKLERIKIFKKLRSNRQNRLNKRVGNYLGIQQNENKKSAKNFIKVNNLSETDSQIEEMDIFGPQQFTEDDLNHHESDEFHLHNQSYKSRESNPETVLNQQSSANCLICLKPFLDPVTSVQCWHVYCATCWLSQLAADSCCPQCKTTTSIKGLRRVLF